MLYTPLTKKAMRLAYEAHRGQLDKCGIPYIFHPMHLAEQMDSEEATTVALLHDVVEDTVWTLEALENEGFPPAVLDALRLLTHDESVPYMDYIKAIKVSRNTTALAVKLADLRHNSDLSRMDTVDARALSRTQKYKQAITLLLS